MSVRINVDPARLETSASHIEQMYLMYEKEYRLLFQYVENLKVNWQGKDNQAFVQQIESFEKDFIAMQNVMKEYAEFLKQCAKAYRMTQNECTSYAKRLFG